MGLTHWSRYGLQFRRGYNIAKAMITGTVLNGRPMIALIVRGPGGQADVETVLDTGFNGFLTLPPAIITALALPFLNYFNAGLADGSRISLQVYGAVVIWDG